MKITQEKGKFRAVTITLESERELAEMYLAANSELEASPLFDKIFEYIFSRQLMSINRAESIINEETADES